MNYFTIPLLALLILVGCGNHPKAPATAEHEGVGGDTYVADFKVHADSILKKSLPNFSPARHNPIQTQAGKY